MLTCQFSTHGGGFNDAKARWDAVPQHRKDNLEKFLAAQRKNPLGPILK